MKMATNAERVSIAKLARRGSDMNRKRSGATRNFNAVRGEENDFLAPGPDESRDSDESVTCRHTTAERRSAVMSIANTHSQPQLDSTPVSSGPRAAPTMCQQKACVRLEEHAQST